MSDRTQAECVGCDKIKTVPMIRFDDSDPAAVTEGLCAECEQNYGMQIGDSVRLHQPDENGDTVVQFINPEIDAIRVRSYKTGITMTVTWQQFEQIK